MPKSRNKSFTIIKYSRVNKKAVWIYQGPTKGAAKAAYRRARKRENIRVRWWCNRMKRRAMNLKDYLDRLVSSLPLMGDIPPEKQQAIRDLRRLADTPPKPDTDFYDHLQSERKRRKRERDERERRKRSSEPK